MARHAADISGRPFSSCSPEVGKAECETDAGVQCSVKVLNLRCHEADFTAYSIRRKKLKVGSAWAMGIYKT